MLLEGHQAPHTVHPIPSHIVLKLLPLPALKFMELLEVGEPLCGRLKARFLTVYSFPKKLLCADLLRGLLDYQYMGFGKKLNS